MGHRMSSLPLAQFCSVAPVLSEQYGSGRAAAKGRAFHAVCAGEEGADALLAQLTDEECQEVMGWKRPTDVVLGDVVLQYADATKEVEVAFDEDGNVTENLDDAITVGHIDFAWVTEVDGHKVAYVADIKKSEWTVTDGARSLQLEAYGLAWATKHDCDSFAVGIWAATEGTWTWSELHDMFEDAPDIWERVRAAALNMGKEACTGPHCSNCYARQHCKEHLLPAVLLDHDTFLAKFAEGGSGLQTDEDGRKALEVIKAMEDLVKVAKKGTQEWARRRGGIVSEDGKKVYKAISTKGRKSLDEEKLLAALGTGSLDDYKKEGKAFDSFRWVNNK